MLARRVAPPVGTSLVVERHDDAPRSLLALAPGAAAAMRAVRLDSRAGALPAGLTGCSSRDDVSSVGRFALARRETCALTPRAASVVSVAG